jgi:hypothetical protein
MNWSFYMLERIANERDEHRRVTRNLIMQWALDIKKDLELTSFNASNGWLEGFMQLPLYYRQPVVVLGDRIVDGVNNT